MEENGGKQRELSEAKGRNIDHRIGEKICKGLDVIGVWTTEELKKNGSHRIQENKVKSDKKAGRRKQREESMENR